MEEKDLSEQESLRLITEMISKAKHGYHETGTSAIIWGSVVAVCGLMSFAESFWNFYIGFDIWLLTLVAFIPQIFISIREKRQRKVISHTEAAMNLIWIVFTISIFALIFYFNIVPDVTDKMLAEGTKIVVTSADGSVYNFHHYIPSAGSLLLLLYAIPTLSTGLAYRFKAMIYASVLCYAFFIISCFTPFAYDMLLNGLAGIFNWLIPGLILRRRCKGEKKAVHV